MFREEGARVGGGLTMISFKLPCRCLKWRQTNSSFNLDFHNWQPGPRLGLGSREGKRWRPEARPGPFAALLFWGSLGSAAASKQVAKQGGS